MSEHIDSLSKNFNKKVYYLNLTPHNLDNTKTNLPISTISPSSLARIPILLSNRKAFSN